MKNNSKKILAAVFAIFMLMTSAVAAVAESENVEMTQELTAKSSKKETKKSSKKSSKKSKKSSKKAAKKAAEEAKAEETKTEAAEEVKTVEAKAEETKEEVKAEEAKEEKKEEKAEAKQEKKEAEKSVTIEANRDMSDVELGDKITLTATLEGYEGVSYKLQWQVNDGDGWKNIKGENGKSYTFTFTMKNAGDSYRLVVKD